MEKIISYEEITCFVNFVPCVQFGIIYRCMFLSSDWFLKPIFRGREKHTSRNSSIWICSFYFLRSSCVRLDHIKVRDPHDLWTKLQDTYGGSILHEDSLQSEVSTVQHPPMLLSWRVPCRFHLRAWRLFNVIYFTDTWHVAR